MDIRVFEVFNIRVCLFTHGRERLSLRSVERMISSRIRYTNGGVTSGRGRVGGGSFVQPYIYLFMLVTKCAIKEVMFKTVHYLTFNIVQVYSLFDNG